MRDVSDRKVCGTKKVITRPTKSMRRTQRADHSPVWTYLSETHLGSASRSRWIQVAGHPPVKIDLSFWKSLFLEAKLHVSLPFEQHRFYNPHHHPEMPRTLQSPGRRVGHAEEGAGCTMIRLASSGRTSDPGSIGDTFEREDLLRSME